MVSDSMLLGSNELYSQEPLTAAATSVCLMDLLGAIVFSVLQAWYFCKAPVVSSPLVVSQTSWNDNEWPKQWHHRYNCYTDLG